MKPYQNRETAKPNPAGENNRAPMPMAKREKVLDRKGDHAGMQKPIPSTMGYVGKKIK